MYVTPRHCVNSLLKFVQIAEKLYQQGFLSYPRTETDQYDPNFDFMSLIGKQTYDATWGAFATQSVRCFVAEHRDHSEIKSIDCKMEASRSLDEARRMIKLILPYTRQTMPEIS